MQVLHDIWTHIGLNPVSYLANLDAQAARTCQVKGRAVDDRVRRVGTVIDGVVGVRGVSHVGRGRTRMSSETLEARSKRGTSARCIGSFGGASDV